MVESVPLSFTFCKKSYRRLWLVVVLGLGESRLYFLCAILLSNSNFLSLAEEKSKSFTFQRGAFFICAGSHLFTWLVHDSECSRRPVSTANNRAPKWEHAPPRPAMQLQLPVIISPLSAESIHTFRGFNLDFENDWP